MPVHLFTLLDHFFPSLPLSAPPHSPHPPHPQALTRLLTLLCWHSLVYGPNTMQTCCTDQRLYVHGWLWHVQIISASVDLQWQEWFMGIHMAFDLVLLILIGLVNHFSSILLYIPPVYKPDMSTSGCDVYSCVQCIASTALWWQDWFLEICKALHSWDAGSLICDQVQHCSACMCRIRTSTFVMFPDFISCHHFIMAWFLGTQEALYMVHIWYRPPTTNHTCSLRDDPYDPILYWSAVPTCRYVSDVGINGYKWLCQHKVLQSANLEPQLSRIYPTCFLEWRAIQRKANMALEVKFPDGEYLCLFVCCCSSSSSSSLSSSSCFCFCCCFCCCFFLFFFAVSSSSSSIHIPLLILLVFLLPPSSFLSANVKSFASVLSVSFSESLLVCSVSLVHLVDCQLFGAEYNV